MIILAHETHVEESDLQTLTNLLGAAGVFETIRVQRSATHPRVVSTFRLASHIQRLHSGAVALGFRAPEPEEIQAAIATTLQAFNWTTREAARLRIFAQRESWCVALSDVGEVLPNTGTTLASVVMERSTPQWKTSPGLISVAARQEAQRRGAHEALLISPQGEVREGAWSSFFWFDLQGTLHTACDGVLFGITRQAVLDIVTEQSSRTLAPKWQLDSCPCTLQRLRKDISEAFVTNAMIGIVPVIAIDDLHISGGQCGSRTALLQQTFRERIGRESIQWKILDT